VIARGLKWEGGMVFCDRIEPRRVGLSPRARVLLDFRFEI
jgi:hypothetical protein